MPKKQHPLAAMITFARTQPPDMVEAALALMRQELKSRKPTMEKLVAPKKVRPSHVPPVNEASLLGQ